MPQAGYVYIIHGQGTNYIKIGKTTALERRLGELAQGVPFRVALLYAELVHDMDHAEQALKARYQAFHARGEWFELSPEALAYWPTETAVVRPLKPVMLKPTQAKPPLTERVMQLLATHSAMTARDLCRYIRNATKAEVTQALMSLLEAGTIQVGRMGKRVQYLRVVRSETEEHVGEAT
jgi:T5orf172 domain